MSDLINNIKEEMWCMHCEHRWLTLDYANCEECPSCKTEPVTIFRTSSTSYFYAYIAKHPEIKKEWGLTKNKN